MFRVLIVDDESYVVDWISSLLETQQNIELDIYRSYSADEALEWLNRAKIDILISDIRMPGMNGISLVKKVKNHWPGCKVILLTAYSDFEYAYQAIKNDVESYILKTESDEHILAEVKKVIDMLNSELNNRQLLDEAQEHMKNSVLQRHQLSLLNILKGEYDGESKIAVHLRALGMDAAPDGMYVLLVGRLESEKSDENGLEESYDRLDAVNSIVRHYLEPHLSLCSMEYEGDKLVWIIEPTNQNGDCSSTAGAVTFLNEMLETIQQSCDKTLNITISFALSAVPLATEQLPERFLILTRMLSLHGYGKFSLIVTDSAVAQTINGKEIMVEPDISIVGRRTDITQKLKSCLENGRKDEYMKIIKDIKEKLSKYSSWNSNSAMEIYYSAALAIITYVNQRNITVKIAFKIGLGELFRPWLANSWGDSANYLVQLSEILFELQQDDENRISYNIIRFLKEYIQKHITQDISLVRLSEVTGYNASYLSRSFKELTGETLNEYIAGQKMEIIRQLLLEVQLNINEVAEKAGFESRTYFNRFVRRFTEKSPQEYREYLIRG